MRKSFHPSKSAFLSSAFAVTLTAVSSGGDTMTLTVEEEGFTTATREAMFCNLRRTPLMTAELWMPSMGHGSSSVSLYPQADGCTRIGSINFVMRGDWEIRVRTNSNDTGVFPVSVRP